MEDRSHITIRFGGEGNINVETLTSFLEQYKQVLFQINNELGHNPNDLIVEVSPPENGSFKIKLKSKYKDLILDKIGDLTTGTLVGLVVLFASNINNGVSKEEVEQILDERQIKDKEVKNTVYNIFQKGTAQKQIQQTFIVVNKDANINSLIIEQQEKEFVHIERNELPKLIEKMSNLELETAPQSDILTDEAMLIIKTIHFEGNAKWAFVFRGYPIKAYIKDPDFLTKLKSESFRKGDSLKVVLSRKRNFDEDLRTYIVDQNSYVIEKVINHISKIDNQGKLNL
jgi:hypothetical protein